MGLWPICFVGRAVQQHDGAGGRDAHTTNEPLQRIVSLSRSVVRTAGVPPAHVGVVFQRAAGGVDQQRAGSFGRAPERQRRLEKVARSVALGSDNGGRASEQRVEEAAFPRAGRPEQQNAR
jgi:hypothetical protein